MGPENGAGARIREGLAGTEGAGARDRPAPASCDPGAPSPRPSRAFCRDRPGGGEIMHPGHGP